MTQAQPATQYLKDYRVTDYQVDTIHLHFDLLDDHTDVSAVIHFSRHPDAKDFSHTLYLNGEDLCLKSVAIDGEALASDAYTVTDTHLVIENCPETFVLETQVQIDPAANTQLSGLYQSRGNYCTQCEAEGFRRITYFYDRPDVMTRFTTCISADSTRYPVLLSNGNCVETKDLPNNRRWVKWEDPSLKPCYLFALVAGDYECLDDQFTTCSGRDVALKLYLEPGFLDQGAYALEALKRSMRWDEQAFGREYDLDIFMIVAVSDFNMGAMENKGLNIFNTKYVLAKPETATDQDYTAIESVIGHEYFHNWSGNRVTCRDWFQITLKEGLTIYRDQNFTADMTSAGVSRINNVNILRQVQFPQDAGPMAHPIRPESYIEVNNFYTVTVYNKGSEVIRMIECFLGKETFREGMDLYFSRYDGKAVTTDDFVKAMADVSGRDLTQFMRWYRQAGTPVLTVDSEYDADTQQYLLKVRQHCDATVDASEKLPFELPLAMALLDQHGTPMPVRLGDEKTAHADTRILSITEAEQSFIFNDCVQKPVPSLLRAFSAPVKLHYPYTQNDYQLLLMHDTDAFCRWEAAQRYYLEHLLKQVAAVQRGESVQLDDNWVAVTKKLLTQPEPDAQLLALLLVMPSAAYINQHLQVIDVDAVHEARKQLHRLLAKACHTQWQALYARCHQAVPYVYESHEVGRRALQNVALGYLCSTGDESDCAQAARQYNSANNMTDTMGALMALNNVKTPHRKACLDGFYDCWQAQPLVVDKWIILQASSTLPGTLARVKSLLSHPGYDANNPNKVRSLVGAFAGNAVYFHAEDGSGYEWVADQIALIDVNNAQLSARLAEPFTRMKRYDAERQALMRTQIEKLLAMPQISSDLYEVLHRTVSV